MKIKFKIISTFLLVFSVVSTITALAIGTFITISMTRQAYGLIDVISVTKAEHLRSYLNSQREVINMLGASTVFRDYLNLSTASANINIEKKRVFDRLVRTIATDNNINEIFLIDKNANVVVSTDVLHEGSNKSDDSFFVEGRKKTYIKEVYLSPITKNLAWGLATPISNDINNDFLGVVAIRLNVDPFFSILKTNHNLGKSGESFLINQDKYFLTPSIYLGADVILKKQVVTDNSNNCYNPKMIEQLAKTNNYETISNLSGYKKISVFRDYRNILTLGTHAYIPETGWCLITRVDEMEIFGPIMETIIIFVITGIIGIIIFYFVGNVVAEKIIRPLGDLYHGIEIVKRGNLDHRVGTDSVDEIGQLSREFDELTLAVKQSRIDIDQKVALQTKDIVKKSQEMENQQKAIINILEDVEDVNNDLAKFKMAVENASDHIVITDPDGIILYANRAVTTITGFEKDEIIGKKAGNKQIWGGMMSLDFYQHLWKIIKVDKKVFVGEVNNHRKNGQNYIAMANISPVLNNNGELVYFVGIERDITHEKEVDRMKTDFISLASHQLRTPLSAMRWFSEMLLAGDAGKLTKNQQEYVTNISQSNDRMINLVNSLLNISRIESGRIIIDPQPTDLSSLVNDVLKEIDNKIKEKKQQVIVSVHDNLPKISIDPKLIREVYKNLLTNANKYTPIGGEISIFISKKDKEIISQVSDNGLGIPLVNQPHIFEKFYRAENIIKLETEGTGLGLYLAKAIVESSKGKIWFESKEKAGTTFWFSLPLAGTKAKKGEVTINN